MYQLVQCRPELGEQRTRKTDAMDTSPQMHQEGKDFSFVIHCDSFALWCIVDKTKQILRREEAR